MKENYLQVGNKITYEGETLYSSGYYDDGVSFGRIYKDEDAFYNHPDEVCYIPEVYFDYNNHITINEVEYISSERYTRKDLEELIDGVLDEDGDPIDIESFFDSLTWCCPETRLNEIAF